MLILSRKVGEAILVDGGIRVVVLGADGSGVRLGIEAPTTVGIVREEVVQRIAEENRRAGATARDRGWVDVLGAEPSIPRAGEPGPAEPGKDPAV